MRSREDALDLVRRAISEAAADGAQAVLVEDRFDRTSFEKDELRDERLDQTETLYLRLIVGAREATSATRDLSPPSVRALAADVLRRARGPGAQEAVPLPGPQRYEPTSPLVPATVLFSAHSRAEGASAITEMARSQGLHASGEYRTGVRQVAVANSNGLEACGARSLAALRAMMVGGAVSGAGDAYARDVSQINPLEVAELALSKAAVSGSVGYLEPGELPVILEHAAVADLFAFLARTGFGAHAAQPERRGGSQTRPYWDRLGERVTSPLLSVTEDPLHPDGLHSPFDYEGVARRGVELIREGVFAGLVHDTWTAAQAGADSTGHAPHPEEERWLGGPMPCSLFVEHGEAEVEDLIRSTRRGMLVSRLGALSMLDWGNGTASGLTRHGTFLVENGVLTRPLPNLRFVQPILAALDGIELLSRERKLSMPSFDLALVVPAMKLAGFRFPGNSA